ncbi:6-hydroxy-D-nicotine oxidase [Madurella fahalii]|uniref:6-hydroxy-D-nicotine oxidase n=1 Tax=Madurella fahalii TaxID=1157608 RepID=A0ABQ0GAF8_9PEZI
MRFLTIAGLCLGQLAASVAGTRGKTCKCFPGDACWPSEHEWDAFNRTVGGRLIKTIPLGSPCHDPHYNEALCEEVRAQWKLAPTHLVSPSSIQAAIFANASCDPFTPRSSACLLGNYVHYAVNVTGPEEIASTIRFAKKRNIRLVIKNTGHDYMGRSTGAGGLSVWTHYLKGAQVKDWSDDGYTGKAIKIGAGALGHEVLEAAAAAGLVVTTGECPTVGVAGGWVQNGGHSPLATAFGLGADQTLEFEVVTADGHFVTARPSSPRHSDLFWALSGAGAGNYGVVVSVTMKAYPDAVTSGVGFDLRGPNIDFSAVLNAWHATLPGILDAGAMATYLATKDQFFVHPVTGYNRTQADLEAALAPFIASLAAMDIALQPTYTQFASYHDFYMHYFGPLPAGQFGTVSEQLLGSRLLTRAHLRAAGPAINATLQMGATFIGQAMDVSRFGSAARAVLPQWREAAASSAFCLPYDVRAPIADMRARQDRITGAVMPVVDAVAPGAGAYINEADYQEADWQRVFFGANYARLLRVKRRYDPEGVFYNRIAVGSEKWEVRPDGRMCEAP